MSDTELLSGVAWLGDHALALYAALLALLLVGTAIVWRVLQRSSIPRPNTSSSSINHGVRLALGGGLIVAGTAIFAAVAEELMEGPGLLAADLAFTGALASAVPVGVVSMFAAVTHLGDTPTLTVLGVAVAIALLARRRGPLALAWTLALGGNAILNVGLKQIFERVRPLHSAGGAVAHGFSFPSGHSSGTWVACGMLAYLGLRLLPPRWHLPLLLTAVALAFTVGSSRVFLRVHFASDVAAGFASGTAWLALCVTGVELARWLRRRAQTAP